MHDVINADVLIQRVIEDIVASIIADVMSHDHELVRKIVRGGWQGVTQWSEKDLVHYAKSWLLDDTEVKQWLIDNGHLEGDA